MSTNKEGKHETDHIFSSHVSFTFYKFCYIPRKESFHTPLKLILRASLMLSLRRWSNRSNLHNYEGETKADMKQYVTQQSHKPNHTKNTLYYTENCS